MTKESEDLVVRTSQAGDILAIDSIDDYEGMQLSEKAKEVLSRLILNAGAGLVTLTPLICQGSSLCPFKKRCPIYLADGELGSYPTNRQCIVEASLLRDKFSSYLEEFNFSVEEVQASPTLRALLSKLTELDLYDFRCDMILAGIGNVSDATLLIKQAVGYDKDEDKVIEQLQEHPTWKIKERIQRQRMEILDALVATPKRKIWEKVALKKHDEDDYVSQNRKLQEKLDLLLEAISKE